MGNQIQSEGDSANNHTNNILRAARSAMGHNASLEGNTTLTACKNGKACLSQHTKSTARFLNLFAEDALRIRMIHKSFSDLDKEMQRKMKMK